MKYGLYLPNFGPFGDARALAELAQAAEEAGWDGFFIWDHIAGRFGEEPGQPLPMVDPWVALAAIAMRTSRMRIGTTVTPLPRRRPWKLARETASVDQLSKGRLILGVGIGLGAAEWADLGEEADPKTRGGMLDEGLEVLAGLWSGEPFSFEGRFYQLQEAHFLPRPVQRPRIPIWVGGFWPNAAPFRRALAWDGVFPLFRTSSQEEELRQFRELMAYLQQQRDDLQGFDVVVTGITPADAPDAAADILRPYAHSGATWWLEVIAPFRFQQGFAESWPMPALRRRVLQGPPRL